MAWYTGPCHSIPGIPGPCRTCVCGPVAGDILSPPPPLLPTIYHARYNMPAIPVEIAWELLVSGLDRVIMYSVLLTSTPIYKGV